MMMVDGQLMVDGQKGKGGERESSVQNRPPAEPSIGLLKVQRYR